MLELKRHAPVGRPRRLANRTRARGLAHVYVKRSRGHVADLYTADRVEARRGGGFRWFFSTCLAAAVGAIAIAAVILGSIDVNEGRGGLVPALRRASETTRTATRPTATAQQDGLQWSLPKVDKLQMASGAMAMRFVVHEPIRQKRGTREYIHNKPYARITARLAAVPVKAGVEIPAFNPLRLYSNPSTSSTDDAETAQSPDGGDVSIRITELHGSLLPAEDGQELESQEVEELVQRSSTAARDEAAIRPTFLPEGADLNISRALGGSRAARGMPLSLTPNTTVLEKTTTEADDIADDTDGRRIRVRLNRGETLTKLLQRMGADAWQARAMVDAGKSILPEASVTVADEIELTMAPSLTHGNKLEPIRFSVFREGGEHLVTVARNPAGEFFGSQTALDTAGPSGSEDGQSLATSLYSSFYHAALLQGMSEDTIQLVLRLHAYDTDFRRRARGNDSFEMFFDIKDDDKSGDGAHGDLLQSAMTIGGDTQRYYRFRTPDGQIDYYDEYGNNSRKFLMRRPVRSEEVRLVSGFGLRFHPLLNARRMHSGVDWAGPIGLPILAAGNGVIEEVGPKGQYGNYIRIRHANGYQTAYGHMRGFASTSRAGAKVRQGQTIGFLGNTGLSTGPHVHFEVLVGNRFVDPMSIQVPREKKLEGKQLADFQRERSRIDDLMRRPPALVQQIDGR